MRLAAFIGTACLVSCVVDLPDPTGLACDDAHPCGPGRDCLLGRCHAPASAAGGGAGGGTAGGAPGGGAGGGAVSLGRVLWRQRLDGFTGQSRLGTASLDLRADAGNEITSTVFTPDDANDRATADEADARDLPATGSGHLKGRFTLSATPELHGPSTFVRLESTAGVVVSLTLTAAGALVVHSDTAVIGSTAATQTVSWPGGFTGDTPYTVDVAWKRGERRSLAINGMSVLPDVLGDDAGTALAVPTQLRLGIFRYDADPSTTDAGWSVTLSEWQLADDPSVPL